MSSRKESPGFQPPPKGGPALYRNAVNRVQLSNPADQPYRPKWFADRRTIREVRAARARVLGDLRSDTVRGQETRAQRALDRRDWREANCISAELSKSDVRFLDGLVVRPTWVLIGFVFARLVEVCCGAWG